MYVVVNARDACDRARAHFLQRDFYYYNITYSQWVADDLTNSTESVIIPPYGDREKKEKQKQVE